MMRAVPLMFLVCITLAVGQQKPLPGSDRTIPVDQQRPTGNLPSFDLPDFVITGRESIELPVAEKKNLGDGDAGRTIDRPSGPVIVRERPDIVGGAAHRVMISYPLPNTARAYVGTGSFSTVVVGAHASGMVEGIHLQGDAEYTSTSGFAPNTDAERGHISGGVRVPTSLLPGFFESEQVGIRGRLMRRAFRWYATQRPDADRSISSGSGMLGMVGLLPGGSHGILNISYAGGAVHDTSATVREGVFGLQGEFSDILAGLPMTFHLGTTNGAKSGGSGGAYSGSDAGLRIDWSPFELVATSVSAGFAVLTGEGGQKRTLFLPGISASFDVTPQHKFIGRYAPGFQLQSLLGFTEAMPFLDGSALVRHAIIKNRGVIGVESEWNQEIRSAISLESSSWSEYPMISDTGNGGVFRLFYDDITETLVRLSVVAKLPVNHYFSAIAILRSSKGSTSGVSVPYLQSSEVRLAYRNVITERLEAEGSIQIVSARQADLTGSTPSLPGYARADVRVTYSVLSGLKVWAGAHNLLDAKIEHWAGYTETPFALNIGMSYAL